MPVRLTHFAWKVVEGEKNQRGAALPEMADFP